ncbi:PAS domain-containing protein [Rhodocytophaga rosea]|uniref:histidine kinase n=1 Tax=Rhodocytophaga rosea TaxID=2704465 RepID=A0A6C0GHT4_9BACT|nr:CHASE3 domain-containing protein [Rhodocytophaga rosea]QHT67621.1 PAS domain-containing protein [Rhodocytophaga rosea]
MQAPEKDLKYYIKIAYVIGFLVLITISSAAYVSFTSLADRNRLVENTNQIIATSASIDNVITQAESAVRGYVLSLDSAYLKPYINSTALIDNELKLIDSLTGNNPVQQKQIQTLRKLIQDRYALFERTIQLREAGNSDNLVKFFSAKPGLRKTEQIQQTFDNIADEESRLLAARTVALNRSIAFTRYLILIVLATTFGIAVFLYFSTKRQLQEREVYAREMDTLNRELATSNEELSTVNEELKSSNEEVAASNEELIVTNEELTLARQLLLNLNTELETKIQERTKSLQRANQAKSILLEREKAALLEAETQRNRLETLFLQAPALLAINKGPDFIYELANPLYLKTFVADQSIDGRPLAEAIPNLEPAVMDILRQVYQTGERFIGKEMPITIDWEHNGKPYTKYFNLIYEPLHESDGKVSGLITFGYEVTEHLMARRKVEESTHLLNEANIALRLNNEQLAEAQKQFQFLAEFMPQLVWRTKPNGDHDYFNQRWYDYTGLTYEETKDKGWALVLHPDDFKRTQQIWSHCLATGEQYEIEYRFKKYDGTYRWFLGRALPMYNENGEIIKWFGTCTDIHEQKILVGHLEQSREELYQKNEQLNRINTDLDNFIYTASHDLKAPVTNIEGLTTMMGNKLRGKLSEPEKELFRMIQLSVTRLKQTIVDLTEITKVQKDVESSVEPLSFPEIFADIKTDIADVIETSGALITTDFKVEQIHFARKNLRSILYNLLTNAIKYKATGRQPEISLATDKVDEYIRLSVRDNGLGIRKDQLDKIFMMFKRAHTHVEGTGIGLYIVKRIIENSGGKITVESQEGVGTTFMIYFKEI